MPNAVIKNNTANVSVGGGVRGGYLLSAPITAKVPGEDDFWDFYDSPWPDYENLGFVSSDGLSDGKEQTRDNITDLNGDVIAQTNGTTTETWAFMLAEVKKAALQEQYGYNNVTDKAGVIHVRSKGDPGTPRVYVALVVLKDGRKALYVMPHGEGAISGELVLNSTTLHARQMTVTAFADEDGTYVHQYIESTETIRPAMPIIVSTGTALGKDVADFGDFHFDGNTLAGSAKKQEGFTAFSNDPNEQEGFYAYFSVYPYEGVTITSSRKPENVVQLTEEDHDVILFLGKDAPTATKSFTLTNSDGSEETFPVSVTAAED